MQRSIIGQHATMEARKLQIKLNIQTIHEKLMMSGLLFKIGPFFQYLIFHDHNETVLISDPSEAYQNLKRECNVWLGKIPARFEQSISDMKKVSNYQQLRLFQERRNKELIINVFYREHGHNDQQLRQYYEGKQHKLSKLRFYDVVDKQSLEKKKKNLNLNNSKLPNFYEMCSDIKQKRNQQKFNMYWMLASQNLQQSCKDFRKFYQFYLKKEIEDKIKINQELEFYLIQYHREQFRTPETQFKLYTSDNQFYKIINNCLRSFTDPQDFAHIRFPFYRLFVSVNQLFFQQENQQFRVKGFTCFRGCQISQEQLIQLQQSVGKYIQINSFLSTSFSEKTAQIFGSILFKIKVPPRTSCNTEMFGSFANIRSYSFYFQEDEIVFNPLNIFRVLGFQKQNEKIYYHLEYVNIDSSFPQSALTQNVKKHYDFHKQMLILNRNQGEYLWRRLNQKNAILFYQTKICHLLAYQKKRLQKNKGIELKLEQQRQVAEMAKILYNELKLFAKHFCWYKQEDKNLLLVSSFHKSNRHRAVQLYFYIAKIHERCHHYQRVLPYLLVCYNDVQRLIPSNSGLIYIVITNLAISLLNLDQYTLAIKLFELAHNKISTNYRLWSHVFGLVISPAILAYQTGNIKDRKKFEDLLGLCLKVPNSSYENNPWLKFIINFEKAETIKEFHEYHKKTFNRKLAFLQRISLQIVQQLILEFERIQFEDTIEKLNNAWMRQYHEIKTDIQDRLQSTKANIRIIINVLQDMDQFNLFPILINLGKKLAGYIEQKNKSQETFTVSTRDERVKENIGQFNYFRMKSFILEIKYKAKMKFMCRNKDTQWNSENLKSISIVLHTKFPHKLYIHLLFLIVLVEICLYRRFIQAAFYFLGLIRKIEGGIKLILTIHKQQILFLLRKAKLQMKYVNRKGYFLDNVQNFNYV